MKRRPNFSEQGFTLIELMIAVAVVAILASIAVPSYMEYVRRGNRAEARTALLAAAARMQQGFTLTNSYVAGAPASFNGTSKYAVSLVDGTTASTFTLQAAPLQTDKCGTFTVDQSGQRSLKAGTYTASVADCLAGK